MNNRAPLLLTYLQEVRAHGAKLRPGRFDCALYAAEWVKRCTGQDLASEWRGTYRRLSDGRAKLRQAGYSDPVELAAAHLIEIQGWQHAQLGDVAAIEEEGETAFGLIGGPQIHVLSDLGLDYVFLERATRIFRP